MASVAVEEIAAKTSRGKPMPMPKKRKRSIFSKKPIADMVLVKRAAIKRGLQGTTMAPKKKPNMKALIQGLRAVGVCALGKNFPTSTLNINSKLITSSTPKAIGDTMPMIFVSDAFSILVKISPSMNMNRIAPEVIIRPKKKMVVLRGSFSDSWLVRYTKKPGYRGKTQTAPSGVSKPKTNAAPSSDKSSIIDSLSVSPK